MATEVSESAVDPETNQELRARFDLCLTNDLVKIIVENKSAFLFFYNNNLLESSLMEKFETYS